MRTAEPYIISIEVCMKRWVGWSIFVGCVVTYLDPEAYSPEQMSSALYLGFHAQGLVRISYALYIAVLTSCGHLSIRYIFESLLNEARGQTVFISLEGVDHEHWHKEQSVSLAW
jgi:hypothetical protein